MIVYQYRIVKVKKWNTKKQNFENMILTKHIKLSLIEYVWTYQSVWKLKSKQYYVFNSKLLSRKRRNSVIITNKVVSQFKHNF